MHITSPFRRLDENAPKGHEAAMMYTVEEVQRTSGKGAVIVRRNQKLVGAASVPFIRWMHENVPASQLSPEQVALVDWFQKNRIH